MKVLKQKGVALITASLLAACASDRGEPLNIEQKLVDHGYVMKEPVSNPHGKVLSWSYVDHSNLIIRSSTKNWYLVSLKSPSFELSSATNIGFTTHFNNLTNQDKVIVSSPSGVSRRFQIDSLYRLEKPTSDADRP
jgi:hypothetical protein